MSTNVDLRQLAIDRGGGSSRKTRLGRHALTRYALPLALLFSFLTLVGWAGWDIVFPPQPVTVIPVCATEAQFQQAGTPLFQAAGWIEPRPTPVGVPALAAGTVDQLLVVEDQPVTAGQPVAILFKADAELDYQQALADLKLCEAELDGARARHVAAQTRWEHPVHLVAALAEAEGDLAQIDTQLHSLPFDIREAEARRDAAQQVYQGKTSAEGVVAAIQIEMAESELKSAQAHLEGMLDRAEALQREQAALAKRRDALKTQLELLADETAIRDESESQVRVAEARVEQARVAVAQAELRLDRMTVRAPIDGRVYQLISHPGSYVGAHSGEFGRVNRTVVVTLYRPTMLQVRVDVRFEDIPKVRLKQTVRIENPAHPEPLLGNVLFVGSEADIQKNTLQVKVAIDNPPAVLKPEMLVDVTFLAPETPDTPRPGPRDLHLYIPRQLVHTVDGTSHVWLADQSADVARQIPIQIGASGPDGTVEITDGLKVGSRIIAGGTTGLQPGMRIRITGEEPTDGRASRP